MGHLIAIGNLKGGTGKSTIAVNLACAFAHDGADTLLVDADAQGTSTDWHAGHRLPVAVETLPVGRPAAAARWVSQVRDLRARHDLTVIDLPPHRGYGIASALVVADVIAIPITPSGIDLCASRRAIDFFRRARAVRGGRLPAALLVPNRVDCRTVFGRRLDRVLDSFGLPVGPAVRQRAAFVEAFTAGCWVGARAPGSAAHREIVQVKERLLTMLDDLDAGPADTGRRHLSQDQPHQIPESDPALRDVASAA